MNVLRGWQRLALKRIASVRYGLGQPPPSLEGGVPLIRATNIKRGRMVDEGLVFVDPAQVPPGRDAGLRAGEIVVVRSGAYTGDSALVPARFDGAIAGYDMVVRIRFGEPRFFAWQMLASNVDYQFQQVKMRAAQPHLNAEELGETIVCVPPLAEQAEVADFLDRETARIDALVAKQGALITALVSHRLALTTEAVTRGLRSPVAWHQTGLEILPFLPSHWRVSRVKHLCSHVVDCLHTTPHYDGDLQYPCVRTADIEPGRLLLEQVRLVNHEVYRERIVRLRPRRGDILYSREGERFGIAALVPPGVDLCLGQRMMMFRTREEHCSSYLMWVLNSAPTLHQVQQQVFGATSPHINIGAIVNFVVPVPPRDEQEEIAGYISARMARLTAVEARANEMIECLREHRAALITAAVTGGVAAARPLADRGPASAQAA